MAQMNPVILRSLARTFRLHQKTSELHSHLWQAWSGFLLDALTEDELSLLSGHTYDLSPLYRGEEVREWEASWWSASLPAVPSKVLLGACGAGREVQWLLERGYEVDAFEPAASMVSVAQQRTANRATIYQSDYQQFVCNPPDKSFDAVILGWGSFSHVLDPGLQSQLLRTAVQVCPAGPILLSWLPPNVTGRLPRARLLGQKLAQPLRRYRRLSSDDTSGHTILPWAGPIRTFDNESIAQLAEEVGRKAKFGPANEYPHATLI